MYDFNLTGEDLTIGDIYEQCERYIDKEITTSSEKLYYQSALREIDAIKRLITKEDCIDDPTLQRAGIRSTLYETEVGELWQIINESINVGNSFILKYLDVQNLEMSSGERALLNFMSRIYLASQINYIMPDRSFQLHENILLLIDEIDLYLHPEWQRRIVSDLISELNQCFPGHYFQIILTSHSPIVLSDIPRDNSIFLKRIEEQIVQTSREIQTFGANIHMLYRDAFFLENGLAVGEYAQNYINQLITDIRERNITDEEANKKIAIIGEPIIKKKITQMLEHPQKNIVSQNQDTRQQMLAFFRKQKEEIERQIRNLEKGVI